ncbi:MAG: Ig-like domain repeat protein, partial [Gemmatimonadota bacterium]|nr:Ig-like domain repeat protein [Gemmatimonadota bacterium]
MYAQSVTWTATVTAVGPGSGIPTGNVQFKVDGADLGAPVALNGSGQATSPATTSLTIGTHVITAEYTGSANFAASTGTLSPDQTVGPASTGTAVSSAANPSAFGESVTFTATVTSGAGTPTGSVQFKVNGTDLGSAVPLNGSAQATSPATTSLAVGTHVIRAEYGGATNFAGSTGTLPGNQLVNRAATTTTVTSNLGAATVVGEAYTVAVTVVAVAPGAGTPGGSVTVTAGSDICIAPLSGGAGSCQLTSTTAGTKSVTGTYVATTDFLSSLSAPVSHQVNPAATTTTITSDLSTATVAGQAYTVAVSVAPVAPGAGTPLGTVTVSDGTGATCSAPLTGGVGSCPLTSTTSGAKSVTGTYLTTANYATSTSAAVPHTVNAAAADTLRAVSSLTPTGTAGSQAAPAPTVIVVDAFGNPVSGVSVTFTPGSGSVSAGTVTTGTNGQATVDWTLGTTAGPQTLTVSSGTLNGSPVTFTATATPGLATQLAFTRSPPASVVAGTAITPSVLVAVQDANGNTVTTSSASIAVAIGSNPGTGTLSGTTTVNAVSGVATFSTLSIDQAGSPYTLTATSAPLTPATSAQFEVAVGSGNKLAFVVEPSSVVVGAPNTPAIQVAVQDAAGNTLPGATDQIALVLSNDPTGGVVTLSGAAPTNAVNGIATFTNIRLDKAAAGYALAAFGSGLVSATSARSTLP